MIRKSLVFVTLAFLALALAAQAGDSPQEQRHHLMEGMRDAAKPVGKMLKEEMEFDAAVAMSSFQTWSEGAEVFGDLFPEGSETGYDTEAKATVWSDREGFNAALANFSEAVDAAIAANPQSLDELKPAAGPVFQQCKACHEEYRIEDEG